MTHKSSPLTLTGMTILLAMAAASPAFAVCETPQPPTAPACYPDNEVYPPEWWPCEMPFPPNCTITPPLVRISAEEAFDAYQQQHLDGEDGVLLIDVRSPEEVRWVGGPAQVNEIELEDGSTFVPDNFKAKLEVYADWRRWNEIRRLKRGWTPQTDREDRPKRRDNEPFVTYEIDGKFEWVFVSDVERMDLSPVAFNVAVETRDPVSGDVTLNPRFGQDVDALVTAAQTRSVIFFCRSGQRSSVGCYYKYCPFSLMDPNIVAYEVEAVDENGNEVNGLGGFEATSASGRYLGHRGFPGRRTTGILEEPAVSFKDLALPIIIDSNPLQHLDDLPTAPWTSPPWLNRR